MPAVESRLLAIPTFSADGTGALYGTTAALGASTAVEIQLGSAHTKVSLVRFKVKRVSGTAANFQPYLFSKSGVTTAGDISQEYAGASTAVGTLFDPAEPQAGPVPMVTDENGKLYMVLAPDAGADNVFYYMLRFIIHR